MEDIKKKITSCEFCKIINHRLSEKYIAHHIEGNGKGEIIILCSYHHNNLHGFIRKQAMELSLKQNPNFIREQFNQYKWKMLGGK